MYESRAENAYIQQAKASENSREARAKRLKRVRKLTKLSRKDFAQNYAISQGTLQNWETARFGGLTEKGAKLVLEALKQESIHCTFNWLMYGAGIGPQKPNITSVAKLSEQSDNNKQANKVATKNAANIELKLFEQININTLTVTTANNAMLPLFSVGEIVSGTVIEMENIDQLLNEICLVQTESHGLLLRRLQQGSEEGTYTLLATNTAASLNMPVIYNVKIIAAAPVSWIRKQD
jgi:HTH-type transcriptional regulator, cell division transcriptional repressor